MMNPPKNIESKTELELLILSNLSFYESMSFSKIVYDLDSKELLKHPDFDKDQMLFILKNLEKKGLVIELKVSEERQWKRIHKKKSLWRRLLNTLYKGQ